MKKLVIFIVALAFLNFGGGGGVSSQSNFDSMIQTVRDYYELNVAAGRTGNNWLRVLIAFGAETHDSLTPFTAAEAWERVPRWGGWRPVAEALDQLEAQSAPALPTSSPTPTAMPTSAPLPTSTLIPTSAPLPTNTLAPTSTPLPTNTPAPTSTPTATPTIQSVQFEPPQAAPLRAEPAQAEPAQAPPAPTSWEAWVTKEPGDDYNANFSYKVPEGKMVKFKTTLHVQLTPANASVDNVVVYLHAPAAIALNNHALEISDVDNTLTFVPKSASAWTDQGSGHYTRPLYVTFQTVDDNIVKGGGSLGAIEIHTVDIHQQTKKGTGSRGEFFHVDDDLTFPKLGELSYTSNTEGSYAVVSGRMATGMVVVDVSPVGDVAVKGDPNAHSWLAHRVEIPANSPYDTEVRIQKRGWALTFECTGTGLGELVLAPHRSSEHQMLAGYSHRMKVCPKPPPPPPPPPPSPFVEFSVASGYSILGQLRHAEKGRTLSGFIEVSGSAAIQNYSGGSIAKFIYWEEHASPVSIGLDLNGTFRSFDVSCGPGSGWARVYYLATQDGTTVPYSPFHRFRVC